MQDLLDRQFLDNSILDWLIAIAIVVGAYLVARFVYWIFGGVARRLASRSDTKLDDIIIDMVEEPAVVIIALMGLWQATTWLTFSARVDAFLGHAYGFALVLCIGWLLARLFNAIYAQYILPLSSKTDTDIDDQLLPVVRKAVVAIIWAMALIIGLSNAGYDVGALLAGLGLGGLALAMAAKDTVANIFGGLTVLIDHPFGVGDRIKVIGFDGTVTEIGVRSTRLATLEGRMVTIPNATFSDQPVENVSREPSRKVVSNIGLTYDTTPEQMQEAMAILRGIAEPHDALEDNVVTSFNAFGDSAMTICFVYYIKKGCDLWQIPSEINLAILEQFNAAHLSFAFPSQSIYLEKS